MRKDWTKDEETLLMEKYNSVSNEELIKLFPDRTFLSIYKKARKLNLYKSNDIEFLNRSNAKHGEKSSSWNGGYKYTKKGYKVILKPDYYRSDSSGYVLEHVYVFETSTSVKVPNNCCVHHLNGIKDDNRIENLCMMSRGGHTVYHHAGSKRSEETKKNISKAKRGN